MAKRKVLKITPILVIINIIILIIIAGFYIFRLVKYYRLENVHKPNEKILLVNKLIKTQSYIDLSKGLVFDDETNTYVYKGKVDNNYVFYSGILFRILSIDENKNIKMVSDNPVTLMYSGLEKGYNNSYVNKWLNKSDVENTGIFEKILYDSDKYLVNSNLCVDVVDDISNSTCNSISSDNKIVILSLNDYKAAGGQNSFINNNSSYYLSDINSSNDNYYVNNEGEIGLDLPTRIHGVRPVITISANTEFLSGNGSINEPYKFEEHNVSTLADTYVGDIISIDDINYKVVYKDENTVKIVLNDVYSENDSPTLVYFDKKNNVYDSNNALYEYLNDKYLNTLSIKDKIIPRDWYVGKLTLDNLDYLNVYKSKSYTKIGMLTLGDLFVNDLNNIFTLSRGIEDDTIINIIDDSGNIYGDMISNRHYVRPAFSLNARFSIISGIGSIDGPYEIGDIDE